MSEDREPFEEDALSAPPRRGDHGGGAGTFFAGLAIGALLGAGAALFLRSPRGRRVGQYMRDEFDDWREETGRELGRRARRVRQQAGKAARRVGAALEDTFD